MMIGDIGNYDQLKLLNKIRMDLDPNLEISMGMSDDFEEAII